VAKALLKIAIAEKITALPSEVLAVFAVTAHSRQASLRCAFVCKGAGCSGVSQNAVERWTFWTAFWTIFDPLQA